MQNSADVLTRTPVLSVFRRLLNDHVLIDFDQATAQPARIRQCHAAVWSVGAKPAMVKMTAAVVVSMVMACRQMIRCSANWCMAPACTRAMDDTAVYVL